MKVYHGTSYENAESIWQHGIDPSKFRSLEEFSGTAGRALYTAMDPREAAGYGEIVLELVLPDDLRIVDNADPAINGPDAPMMGDAFRDYVMALGYDAVRTDDVPEIAIYVTDRVQVVRWMADVQPMEN